jgi:hypothetical protein
MAVGLLDYSLLELDTDQLKILSDWSGGREVRNSHNALELAKLFPFWYSERAGTLSVAVDKVNKKLSIKPPKKRAFRKNHYAWLKYLDLPKGVPWVLLTLTLRRDIELQDAWCYINRWTSDFLHRMRVYLRKVKKYTSFRYIWVVEAHQDEYPHVHILATFPFVDIHQIHQWWKSEGVHLSAFQGVDVQFIGGAENVKEYVLKYLVKGHHKYWSFSVYQKDGDLRCKVRLSTLFIWYFRVKLFGMSRNLRRPSKPSGGGFSFFGFTNPHKVWRVFYRPYGIAQHVFWSGFIECGGIERDIFYLPYLSVRCVV